MFRRRLLGMVIAVGLLVTQSVPPALAAGCEAAQFVSDLTIPDGSAFAPGTAFTKSWRLLNTGTCAWTTSYSLVWAGGDQMKAPLIKKLPVNVPPGQMVDLSVNLVAPSTAGHYKGLFKISNPAGSQFGIGSSGSDPFWADINVVDVSAVIYDFVTNAPYAQWKSGAGLLPFPGASGDFRGYSSVVDSPHLEDDSFDSSAGLLTVPQNKFNGYIQATYPELQIQAGDRLQTLVNCEFGATGCYATFRIDYLLPNNTQKTLWTWKEAYDKKFYRANIDLSSLAGQKVRFVFMLLSSGFASGDRAIWGSPRIVRSGMGQPPAPPATLTSLPPVTPTSTPLIPPPPTVSPSGCDKATFVTDVTVQDGAVFAPGAAFTKTWRLKNSGTCVWTTAYRLIYYSGEQMSAPTLVNLPWGAAYGQTVDVSVNMVAPSQNGRYRGYWILANAKGQFFGLGSDASKPIWVEINVAGESPLETGYSFFLNACSAEWKSGSGRLPCPGAEGTSQGMVIPLNSTQLEDGTMGPAPSLLMSPENKYNGYIQGTFPTFTVQPGDHFTTVTGCEYGYSCYVTFRLDYMTPNGGIFNFWSWREQNDKKNYTANVDLSPLAGRSVRFILTILATGTASGDRVRWIGPTIVRTSNTPPVITPSPTFTPVPSDWLTYTNPQYGFEFKYPPQAQIVNQAANSVKMNLPFTPGTTLAEKYLQTSVVENANPCQSPLSATSRPGSPTETIVINGVSFLKQVGGDAAAGNLYDWTGYSTRRGNVCISMDFMLHSLNAIYPPPPEFDKAAESAVFTQVMSTFAFLPATPTPIAVPGTVVTAPLINKLFMMDANNGWAVGNSYALRTVDGGTTWYNLTPPDVAAVGDAFFQNASNGWFLGTLQSTGATVLFRTTSGGSTWTSYSSLPFTQGYIQFLNDLNGFVLAGQPSGMQKHAVQLYQTADGGATWALRYANDPTQPNNSLPFAGHKDGMGFRDLTTGWVGGDYPTNGYVYLFKTTNSGVNWVQQSLPLPAGYESAFITTTAPKFFTPSEGVLPVWMTIGADMRDLFLYITHDGGNTWTPASSFVRNGTLTDFVSLQSAFSWSTDNFFFTTVNSGANWMQVTPNVDFGGSLRDIDFVSASTGWALDTDSNGNTALYRTFDSGAHWTMLFSNIPAQAQPDLAIVETRIELQNTSCLMSGDNLGVRVWIRNTGQAAAGSFVVRVNSMDQTVNGLNAGETSALFFPTTLNPVTIMLDANSTVAESNETNNTQSEMIAVPTPPLPCVTPGQLEQTIVNALNTKDFAAAKALMGQTFGFAFWQSQSISRTPDEAIQQLQANYIGASTVLVPDPNKDLITLLGGSNPYSIMNLDPSKSLALFVSGWGLDGKGEAILFVTQGLDGKYKWDSVLIAPTGFAPPVTLTGPYAVVGVASTDVLNIRSSAGSANPIVGSFPADAVNVMRTGPTASADNATWVEVQNPNGGTGWVNSNSLTEYVTHEAFCADTRIPMLLQQLRGSMDQSNGDMFAGLVSPAHGVNVNLWAYQPAVNFSIASAQAAFTSSTVYTWGFGGGKGGTIPDTGTFAEIIQPKMQEVFGASNMETYCDTLTKVFPLAVPWPYTNIHYYNLYKPSSEGLLDFRSWLIGFEYINGQPYLHSMVTIVWEP